MKILMFGGSGGMGSLLTDLYKESNEHELVSLGSADVDVTDDKAVKEILEKEQPDVVINLAVYNADAPIHKLDLVEVDKQIDVNIKGAIHVMKAAIETMRNKSFGRIIFLSSVLSSNPVKGTSLYSGSKSFIDNLVKTAAIENVKYGITVNSIQLGYFEAGLINKVPKDILDVIINKIPQKRLGSGKELKNAIDFIIDTPYFTGENLPLLGGLNISTL